MNYNQGSFMWAVQEMKKGLFVRQKNWTEGLYYFTELKELIGSNPNKRIFLINIGDSKIIDLERVNLKPGEVVAFFIQDFEENNWISKIKKQKYLKDIFLIF